MPSTDSSGNDYLYNTNLGNRAVLTFTGREVLYVAPKNSSSGYTKVFVGGNLVGSFLLKSSTTRLGQIITRATFSTNSAHTIRVSNDQAGRRTNLDAFIVLK